MRTSEQDAMDVMLRLRGLTSGQMAIASRKANEETEVPTLTAIAQRIQE